MEVRPTFFSTRWASVRLCAALLSVSLWATCLVCQPSEALAGEGARDAQRGWLGIVMDERPNGGVVVKDVMRGSPAEKANLQSGDGLLRVNGTSVRSARDMARAVGRNAAGAVVRIAISRGGKERVVPVQLEPFPSGEQLLRMQHVGRPAPALRGLRTAVGTRGPTLDDFKGKVVVLDFWASWCVACRVTSTHMNRWHDRFASRDLEVLGVAAQPSEEMAQGVKRFGIRYRTCADPDMDTSAAYRVHELPSVIVIDRRGVVRDVATGYDPRRMRQMEALIERLLAEPKPTK